MHIAVRSSALSVTSVLLAACMFFGPAPQPAAQEPAAAPPGNAPEVRLEAHDGKSRFLLGDPIQLDLVFRNATADAYTVNTSVYGDLSEKVEIAPAAGWFQWRGQSGHDYLNVEKLGLEEVRIPVVLDEGIVFREPGHYEIRVTTRRLSRGAGMSTTGYPPVTTNPVGIDLAVMPPEEEAARVRTLLAAMAAADVSTSAGTAVWRDALDHLVALGGEDALRAKIQLILSEDDDMRGLMSRALASTRNLPLQLSLLEAAWRDPAQDPIYDMPAALAQTRALMRGHGMPGWTQVLTPGQSGEARLEAKEHAADMQALIDSLPARSGASRADAAYYLMEDHTLTPAQHALVRPVAIQEFPRMDETEQAMLLETAWPALHDAALIPALRAMLEKSPTDKDAISRLVELDPNDAKPYVIRAVCDTKFAVPLDAVANLPAATLPEVDSCLEALLRVAPAPNGEVAWKNRALLAARFATAAILPALREGWKSSEQDGPALALLLRYRPAEAVARLQASSAKGVNRFFDIDAVYKARHAAFPPELCVWLRDQVKSGSAEDAGTAAYELSQHGAPDDRALIEQRLAELRVHADKADLDSISLDDNLMSSLRVATVWYVNNADRARLASGCLSQQCRLYGAPTPGDRPSQ